MFSRFDSWLHKQRKRCAHFSRRHHDARPEKGASIEFADHVNWTPGSLHHSLPRRLLSTFWSERNINEEVEQAILKKFLKEHGLYNKHQTIQQRRRLKQLLELEQRTALFHRDEEKKHEVVSCVLHSLQTPHITTKEFLSMPFPDSNPTRDELSCFAVSKRVTSLPALLGINGTTNSSQLNVIIAPQSSTILQEVHQLKCVQSNDAWETIPAGHTPSYLETAL